MRPTDIRLPGAVDLSGLRRPPAPPPGAAGSPGAGGVGPGGAGGSAAGSVVIDVTEATFETEVLQRSTQVPVVLDFWAEWCGPCKQLSPVLERLAAEYGGRWVLAKVDVDAEQRLAQAFQIQSIPSVMAVIAGQPVPLFQGAVPDAQVRQVLDEVLRVAAANGVTGTVSGVAEDAAGDVAPEEPAIDPAHLDAEDALARGDAEAAVSAYRSILDKDPTDIDARLGLARCELLMRVRDVDERAVRARAAQSPADVDAATAVADLDMASGHVEDAVSRLVDLVRSSADDEREKARMHLLGLFEVLDPEDPRLAAGRRALANALF